MGRHRNDPRGAGQIAAIAVAVALFITLLALGGFFLYNSLPGSASAPTASEPAPEAEEAGSAEDSVLYIRVVGDTADVVVRAPGGTVLTDTTMTQGQHLSYNHEAMDVTVSDPAAVEVYVQGERSDISGEEAGYTFSVEASG
ncbi:RodZ domain-containing protein [Nocardiopsis coralliicola]